MKKRSFPSSYTVLFIILIFATILTYIIPSGSFKRIEYVEESNEFSIIDNNGESKNVEASQEVLDKYNIKIPLESFTNGEIFRPVSIPGSYEKIDQHPQGFVDFIKAPIKGVTQSVDVMVFVLILGAIMGLLNETGAFAAGVNSLVKITKGHEYILLVIISSLIALGGTTYGMSEETMAFYPILMPVFLACGFDAIVGIATIYMGSSMGTMFAVINPFSTVIASNAAGISFKNGMPIRIIALIFAQVSFLIYLYRYSQKVKKDPTKSIVYKEMPHIREKFLKDYNNDKDADFNWRKKTMILLFVLAFPIMIWGVSTKGWYFEEMSAIFLTSAILMMFVSGLGEKKAVSTFISGASDLVGVALIIGIARAINIILDDGMLSDTILNFTTNIIQGSNGIVFAIILFIVFAFLGIFIPSSSGLATLSMPIIAPLADIVNIGRDVVVSAYNFGQGWMSFITPTGLILATLDLVDVSYDKWLKFIMPFMIYMAFYSFVILAIQTAI